MQAVITGVESFGIFAQGVDLPAEGFVHINSLHDDYYDYDPRGHTLTGRKSGDVYRLGDSITVEVAHVDIDRRELDFRVVRHAKRTAPRKGASTSSSRQSFRRGKSDVSEHRKPARGKKKAAKKSVRRKKTSTSREKGARKTATKKKKATRRPARKKRS